MLPFFNFGFSFARFDAQITLLRLCLSSGRHCTPHENKDREVILMACSPSEWGIVFCLVFFFLSSVFLPDLHGITVVNIFGLAAAAAAGRGCNGTAKQMSV